MNFRSRYLSAHFLKRMGILALLILVVFLCIHIFAGRNIEQVVVNDTLVTSQALPAKKDSVLVDTTNPAPALPAPEAIAGNIQTGKTTPAALVGFAETLLGVPYVYGSSDPKTGFDCSGFITYVFKHFGIEVPRSSIDFTSVGKTISVENAKQGDLILFTGTNEYEKYIGHMGLVVSNDSVQGLSFIHATSGKAISVTISPFNDQYKKRFIRISRIFPQ